MIGKGLRKIIQQLIFLYSKEKEILPAYISKHNATREKTNKFINYSKERKRRMILSCDKKKLSNSSSGLRMRI